MNPAHEPPENPFGGESFARVWDHWQGRRLHTLTAAGGTLYYVSRRWGPSRTLDALPFGVPAFTGDADPGSRRCMEAYFRLPALRTSLSLFARPKGVYPHVTWHEQMRSVVTLSRDWQDRVDSDVKRRAGRAQKDGWEVVPFAPAWWSDVAVALHETDRRHGVDARFEVEFFQNLHERLADSRQLLLPCAVRAGRLGALNVVLAAGGCEVSWFTLSTDEARREGVVPLLWLSWIGECAERGGQTADLGASPSASVQRFKANFGAQLVPYYSGTRRWAIFGGR